MLFDLNDFFEKSTNFLKYGLEPYPPYFLTYEWENAEKEADENIKSEKYSDYNLPEKQQNSLKETNVIIKSKKTECFDKDFSKLPNNVQERIIDKIFPLILTDPNNTAVNIKKVPNLSGRWRVNIDMYYSFTFEISQRSIIFRCIGPSN